MSRCVERRASVASPEWNATAHPVRAFWCFSGGCLRDEKLSVSQRRQIVREVRAGCSARRVALRFGISLSNVQHWLARAGTTRLDRVNWDDLSSGPALPANRTAPAIEDAILAARRSLRDSALGECGASAIQALLARSSPLCGHALPGVRTIGRVLERRGLLDARSRTRRPPPKRGWYLPEVACRKAELDSFDGVEGLVIVGGTDVEVLNVMSLHGSLPGSWPGEILRTDRVLECLLEHWRLHGLPAYAQFDNATLFQGPHHYLDTLGRVARLCLQLGVTPVYAPVRETGFQAGIESYNNRWQQKVWQRFVHRDLPGVCVCSREYVAAYRAKNTALIEAVATLRRPFPGDFLFRPKAPLGGLVVFLRRTDETGRLVVMGRLYRPDPHWQHRLVRVEVDFTARTMQFHSLRRSAPTTQTLLNSIRFEPVTKQTKGSRAHRDVATRGRRLDSKRAKP